MEDIFEFIIKSILKVFKVIFRVIFEAFFQGVSDYLIEKCYKKYPKTCIAILVVVFAIIIFSIYYAW